MSISSHTKAASHVLYSARRRLRGRVHRVPTNFKSRRHSQWTPPSTADASWALAHCGVLDIAAVRLKAAMLGDLVVFNDLLSGSEDQTVRRAAIIYLIDTGALIPLFDNEIVDDSVLLVNLNQ